MKCGLRNDGTEHIFFKTKKTFGGLVASYFLVNCKFLLKGVISKEDFGH